MGVASKLQCINALTVPSALYSALQQSYQKENVISIPFHECRPWWSSLFAEIDEREILPEWFEAENPEDCEDVPETVNTGRPRDLCGDVSFFSRGL